MFNTKRVKDDIVRWIKDWFEKNGPDCNAVIGISGGKDSTVVAALCVEALGKDRVIGVMMPNGEQSDLDVSYKVCRYLGIKEICVNIEQAVNAITTSMRYAIVDCVQGEGYGIEPSDQTLVNLPPRIRMTTLYAISQSLNGRVSNNCNLSENWVGYSTRWGDSVGDFSPLAKLTVAEVKAIGYELGLPAEFIEKVPSDGLCGKTDEDNLGFSYDTLDHYIRTGNCDDPIAKERIDALHKKNQFKQEPIPYCPHGPVWEWDDVLGWIEV